MKRILIIEDDLDTAELERDYLQTSGYQTQIVRDGEQGIKQACDGGYDLAVVDLMLPQKNGYEVVKEIRRHLEIPVIIVSAKNEEIDKIRGLDFGADDYMTKPFSPAELVARVKAHLNRYERLKGVAGGADTLTYKGLEICRLSHRVTVNGRDVQLTAKEYEILLFLASNPNIVFSKEHLFQAIWGEAYYSDTTTATVAVHIQKVRRKIERDPANPEYIETLWGIGYRFNS